MGLESVGRDIGDCKGVEHLIDADLAKEEVQFDTLQTFNMNSSPKTLLVNPMPKHDIFMI